MRSREEIEVEINRRGIDMENILEVLLDIRELLKGIEEKQNE